MTTETDKTASPSPTNGLILAIAEALPSLIREIVGNAAMHGDKEFLNELRDTLEEICHWTICDSRRDDHCPCCGRVLW